MSSLLSFLLSPAAAAQLVAGVAIIMLGAGIPLLFALLLRRNRHRLYDPRVYSSFGLLYEGLSVERGTYAWTSIDMVKKILVVLIASLIKSADFQQVAACVLLVSRKCRLPPQSASICSNVLPSPHHDGRLLLHLLRPNPIIWVQVVSLSSLIWFEPYRVTLFTLMEAASLFVLLLTLFANTIYQATQAAAAACIGRPDSYQPGIASASSATGDATCEQLRSRNSTADKGATFALIALNGGFLLLLAIVLLRLRIVKRLRSQAAKAVAAGLGGAGVTAGPDGGCWGAISRSMPASLTNGCWRLMLSPLCRCCCRACIASRMRGTAGGAGGAQVGSAAGAAARGSIAFTHANKLLAGPGAGGQQHVDPQDVTETAERMRRESMTSSKRWCITRLLCAACCGCRGIDYHLHQACERSEFITAILQGTMAAPTAASAGAKGARGATPAAAIAAGAAAARAAAAGTGGPAILSPLPPKLAPRPPPGARRSQSAGTAAMSGSLACASVIGRVFAPAGGLSSTSSAASSAASPGGFMSGAGADATPKPTLQLQLHSLVKGADAAAAAHDSRHLGAGDVAVGLAGDDEPCTAAKQPTDLPGHKQQHRDAPPFVVRVEHAPVSFETSTLSASSSSSSLAEDAALIGPGPAASGDGRWAHSTSRHQYHPHAPSSSSSSSSSAGDSDAESSSSAAADNATVDGSSATGSASSAADSGDESPAGEGPAAAGADGDDDDDSEASQFGSIASHWLQQASASTSGSGGAATAGRIRSAPRHSLAPAASSMVAAWPAEAAAAAARRPDPRLSIAHAGASSASTRRSRSSVVGLFR